MTETTLTTPPVPAPPLLTSHDACDACGWSEADTVTMDKYVPVATARVRVVFPNGQDLTLCGHHYAEHAIELATHAVKVYDQRAELLTPRPSSTADGA